MTKLDAIMFALKLVVTDGQLMDGDDGLTYEAKCVTQPPLAALYHEAAHWLKHDLRGIELFEGGLRLFLNASYEDTELRPNRQPS